MNKIYIFLSVIILIAPNSWGQFEKRSLAQRGSASVAEQESYFTKPVHLIDLPTASILRGGDLKGSLRLYEEGGVLTRLSVGISRKIMFGISFGGDHIIGGEDVRWNEMPGVHLVYRVIDENMVLPSIVIGLDTQGYGKYWRKEDYQVAGLDSSITIDPTEYRLDRYSVKSRGFYVVASKGYESWWKVGLHGGMSYSMERSDNDKDPTLFVGMDMQLSRDISFVFEYDFALNDDKIREANNGKGYFNTSFRWAFQNNMYLEFAAKNLLANKNDDHNFIRILRIVYHTKIVN